MQASRAKAKFNNCIHDCGLVDLLYEGQHLLWCNGRLGGRWIWARLDRVLVNMNFLNLFGDVRAVYLPRTYSDHCPMLVSLIKERGSMARPFQFQCMWGSHEGFLPLVWEVWNVRVEGCAMVCISRKLKLLKGVCGNGM